MPRSRLELRSPPWIALAYIVGPACGLTAWLATSAICYWSPDSASGAVRLWPWIMAFGMPVCLMVELLIVTPILIFFRSFRWPWLNGWSAAAIGFLLAGAGWYLFFGSMPPDDSDPPGWQVDVDWTFAGWLHVAAMCARTGIVGVVAALVFRLIAVRSIRRPPQVDRPPSG